MDGTIARAAVRICEVRTMDDLISRQAVIDRINKQREHLNPSEDFRDLIGDSAYKTCIEFIERLPSVQKTGHWKLLRKGNDTSDYECTNCLGILMDVENDDHHELQRYCGMCGARMVGEEE